MMALMLSPSVTCLANSSAEAAPAPRRDIAPTTPAIRARRALGLGRRMGCDLWLAGGAHWEARRSLRVLSVSIRLWALPRSTLMPRWVAASSLSSAIELVGCLQHQGEEAQVLVDGAQVADDGVHHAVRILDGRAHVLLRVVAGRVEPGAELVEAEPGARHHDAQGLAGGGVAAAQEGQRAGAVAADAAGEHVGGDLGVVEEPAEPKALGKEAAGRVEDDGDSARGRQLGDLGLQLGPARPRSAGRSGERSCVSGFPYSTCVRVAAAAGPAPRTPASAPATARAEHAPPAAVARCRGETSARARKIMKRHSFSAR